MIVITMIVGARFSLFEIEALQIEHCSSPTLMRRHDAIACTCFLHSDA